MYEQHYRDLTKRGGMKVHVPVIEILPTKSDVRDNPGKNNATENPGNQKKFTHFFIVGVSDIPLP